MDAVKAYAEGITENSERGAIFPIAYYIEEMAELAPELYKEALRDATEKGDLWWQVRALQELGWEDSERELLLANAAEIEKSANLMLKTRLAWARGDRAGYVEARKRQAQDYGL
jgi:hypothetical protein